MLYCCYHSFLLVCYWYCYLSATHLCSCSCYCCSADADLLLLVECCCSDTAVTMLQTLCRVRDWDPWKYNVASTESGIAFAISPYFEVLTHMSDEGAGLLQQPRHSGWVAATPSNLVQDGLIEFTNRRPDKKLPATGTPLKEQEECTPTASSGSSITVGRRMDMVFMTKKPVVQQQPPQSPQQQQPFQQQEQLSQMKDWQQQQQQASQQQQQQHCADPLEKAVCICVLQTPTSLMQAPVNPQPHAPINLIKGYQDLEEPSLHVLGQVRLLPRGRRGG